MTRAALLALLSHWRRHPGQAVTLILGLALATALWSGVQAINGEARASYDRAARALAQNDLPRLVPREGQSLPLSAYIALRRGGWAVAPILEGTIETPDGRVRLLGLDPLTAPALPAPDAAPDPGPSSDPDLGAGLSAFLGPPGEIRAHPETLAQLAPLGLEARLVPTQGLSPGTAVADIGLAARLLGLEGRLTRLLLLAEPGPALPPLEALAPGLTRAPPEEGTDMAGLTGSFHLNLTAFGALAFAVGLFITHGAIGLAFEQRRPMIRTLRALGTPLGLVIGLLTLEALGFALIAGSLGLALGYGLAGLLLPDVAATLRGLYGAPVPGSLQLRPAWIGAGLGMALAGAALASAQSLTQLARMPLLAPAQPRAWALASDRQQARMGAAGLVAWAICGAATLWGTGLWAGFAALAGLLLGAALCLPWLLSRGLAAAAGAARRPVAQWLWADARQQLPGLSLALMALLLALAANIGVTTMVASFRATFEGWLDQRLAAELYVNFGDDATARAARPFLEAQTDAILPIASVEARLGDQPGRLYGMADHPTYRDAWPILAGGPDLWDRLAAGDGVLVNEQWGHRAGLAPGDQVEIDGRPWPVLGLYSDYGNPRLQAVLGIGPFRAAYPDSPAARFALRTDPVQAAALRAELIARFGLRADAVSDQAGIKAASRQIFERTFAATDALNILTLSVAAFAMLTSLLTLQSLRLPQVAPLWALGLTRAQIARLDLARAALLGLGTALLALPTGLALAWLLLAVVNVQAFGWRLPMQPFPLAWAGLVAAAVLAALLAAALPARRLARSQPADLLRVFANAR